MKILIYVEGPSDKLAMEKLLEPIISEALKNGVKVTFHPMGGKEKLLLRVPKKAFNIISNDPDAYVFALPDLHPPNVVFLYKSFIELKEALSGEYNRIIQKRKKKNFKNYEERFYIHCSKHDLEALILAGEDRLRSYLGVKKFNIKWKIPVEDQDLDDPPCYIVERIFKENGRNYKDNITRYAPEILSGVDFRELMKKCPQNFKPFIEDIQKLIALKSAII